MEKNYYLHKNKKTGEILYLEYDKIKGYPITPKTKIEESSGDIQNTIIEAEKLRVNILNRYIHYLGNTYGSFALNKLQIMINQLRINLYQAVQKERYQAIKKHFDEQELYYLDEEDQKKGRGR